MKNIWRVPRGRDESESGRVSLKLIPSRTSGELEVLKIY